MKSLTSLGAVAALVFAGQAFADYTSFNPNVGGSGEPGLRTIFGNIYGGTFNPVTPGSLDFTNGTVTLTRVRDFVGGATSATGINHVNGSTMGMADDSVWADGTVQIRFETKYASNNNTFGWFNNLTAPNTFQALLGTTPGSSTIATLSSNFEWGLQTVGGTTDIWRSNMFENPGDEDHFITYKVTGLPGGTRWLIAVEDLKFAKSDFDYNDWVGEIEVLIPLPPAAAIGFAGLGLVALVRSARRRA